VFGLRLPSLAPWEINNNRWVVCLVFGLRLPSLAPWEINNNRWVVCLVAESARGSVDKLGGSIARLAEPFVNVAERVNERLYPFSHFSEQINAPSALLRG
jgi:hypothetical protein